MDGLGQKHVMGHSDSRIRRWQASPSAGWFLTLAGCTITYQNFPGSESGRSPSQNKIESVVQACTPRAYWSSSCPSYAVSLRIILLLARRLGSGLGAQFLSLDHPLLEKEIDAGLAHFWMRQQANTVCLHELFRNVSCLILNTSSAAPATYCFLWSHIEIMIEFSSCIQNRLIICSNATKTLTFPSWQKVKSRTWHEPRSLQF